MPNPTFTLLALALATPALAQTAAPTAAPADTTHFYRHHLGLTASPQLDHFFTANTALPVGLLYKYQTKPHSLWRFGLVLNQDYSRQDEYKPDYSPTNLKNNPEYTNSSFGVSASVGREYTHQFARRWTGTAGADVSVGFSQYKLVSSSQYLGNPTTNTPSTQVTQGDRFRYYQVMLSPFIGLRFYPWAKLYISAESAVRLEYMRQTLHGFTNSIDLNTGQLLAGTTDFTDFQITNQYVSMHYRFINQVSVHYQLGKH